MKTLCMLPSLMVGVLFFVTSCSQPTETDIKGYFQLVDTAELLICEGQYASAAAKYRLAFQKIKKPLGKDVFNAALCYAYAENKTRMKDLVQFLVNNMAEEQLVYAGFVGRYLSTAEWEEILQKKVIDYDIDLRADMEAILVRDQLFRPDYETYNDTIEANRKINMNQLLEIRAQSGFPSHFELGYSRDLKGQPHYLVLHHTAQRRSTDKSVMDLEPLLQELVFEGRMDPEFAITYLFFQNDPEKGSFDRYPMVRVQHPLLPDSLQQRWNFPQRTTEQLKTIDTKRSEWLANTTESIRIKTRYLEEQGYSPFLFSSVNKEVYSLIESASAEEAMQMYEFLTASK